MAAATRPEIGSRWWNKDTYYRVIKKNKKGEAVCQFRKGTRGTYCKETVAIAPHHFKKFTALS